MRSFVFLAAIFSLASGACLQGYEEWVSGMCFRYFQNQVDYPTAKSNCVADGTMMLSLHTVEQSDALDLNVTTPKGHFWLGLECDEPTQRYIYTDGSETSLATQYVRFPCIDDVGYHHHTGGGANMFAEYTQMANITDPFASFAAANTLCYHFTENPPVSGQPATFGPDPTQPPSNITACGDCDITDVWLDILFVVDSSDSMGQNGVNDVQATVRSILLHMNTSRDDVRAGVLVYSDKASVVYALGSINSDDDALVVKIPFIKGYGTNMEAAIVTALAHFTEHENDLNARRVIVMFASAYRDSTYKSPEVIAKAFRDEGGVIITVDYSTFGSGAVPMLSLIASSGYEIIKNDQIVEQLGDAFCDANCYCPESTSGYSLINGTDCEGRCPPTGGCYSVVTLPSIQKQARIDCQEKSGDLASVHSDAQQLFITSLFTPRKPFWIGLQKDANGRPAWSDGSDLTYFHYANGTGWTKGDCVYNLQYSGFLTGWYMDSCTKDYGYACQHEPCTATHKDCEFD